MNPLFKDGKLSRIGLLERLAARWSDKPRGPGHPEAQLARLRAAAPYEPDKLDAPSPAPAGEEVNYRVALAAIADENYVRSEQHQKQQWRADRKGAHPDILEFERLLLAKLHDCNVPAFTHCLWRADEQQTALFVQGRSKARAGESPHNHGCAIDVVHGTRGWNISKMSWSIIGHLGKELARRNDIPIEWGGDWKFYDPAHWQLKGWQGFHHRR